MTPRRSWYSTPASTWSVACGSRSRFFAFCDLANVQPVSSSPSRTYQSGTRCGRPFGPSVATLTIFCSSRKSRSSSPVMRIWARGDGIAARSVLGRFELQRRGGGLAERVRLAAQPRLEQVVVVRAARGAGLAGHVLPARARLVAEVGEQPERGRPRARVVAAVRHVADGADRLLPAAGR